MNAIRLVAMLAVLLVAAPSRASGCPQRSRRAAAKIAVFPSLAAAEKALSLHPSEKLADYVNGTAFQVLSFTPGRSEGDRGDYALNAVFLVGTKVVVVRSLATNTTARPADRCMQVDQHQIIALRAINDRIGHFRVLRENVHDTPNLPAQTSGTCTERITYRIEDHFIDLKSARSLAVYDQIFADTTDAALSSLPGLPFDAFTIARDGTITPNCTSN